MNDIGTRAQHLAWAKERALALCDSGNWVGAFTSLASDLSKHSGTSEHPGLLLGAMLLTSGLVTDAEEMREHIEGYN